MLKLKRIVFLVMSFFIVIIIMSVSAQTLDYTELNIPKSLYVETLPVPQEVTEYAKSVFSSLTEENIENMGVPKHLIRNVRLANGFMINETRSTMTWTVYSFPIITDYGPIIGIDVVYVPDYGFTYSMGEDGWLDGIVNDMLYVDYEFSVYSSELGYYYVKDGIPVSEYMLRYQHEYVDNVESQYAQDLMIIDKMSDELEGEIKIVDILEAIIVMDSKTSPLAYDPLSSVDISCKVAHVDNPTYDCLIHSSHGVCWASCVGSIVDFQKGSGNVNPGNALELRDKAINMRKAETGGCTQTGISDTKRFIHLLWYGADAEYTGSEWYLYVYKPSSLTWKACMDSIDNGWPSVMGLKKLENGQLLEVGHAVVLSGYSKSIDYPYDATKGLILAMNPNKEPSTAPDGTQFYKETRIPNTLYFKIGSENFVWTSTVCNSQYLNY